MREYKIRTHGNVNLAKVIADELKKLGYGEAVNSHKDDTAGIVTNLEDELYFYIESSFKEDPGKEIDIYDLIELNRIKSEKEATTELTIEQIRTKLNIQGELKIVE